MHRGFTKLFNTIVTSTIWQEDDKTRIVWITMLAISDADGIVSASIPGLASVSNVSVEAAEKAIKNLESPDKYSRTKDFEGRRIEAVDGGWRILNYVKYRRMLTEEERREYKAKWIKDKRRQMSTKSTGVDASRRSASASASSSASVLKKGKANSLEEVVQYCTRHGLAESDGDWFWYKCEGNGWKNNGKPIVDWQSTVISWKTIKIFPSQKQTSGHHQTMTKYGLPLPRGCTIRRDGEVLDYTGRVMDVNQVRKAAQS